MDRTDVGLKAVAKALTDVIGPSIDPKDPLAKEQLKLAVDYIEFVRARYDDIHARERFDLKHYSRMADAIGKSGLPSSEASRLAGARDEAARTLADVEATTPQVRTAAMELAAVVADVVQKAPSFGSEVRHKIEIAVLDATDERVAMERAWYLPMGFDPTPQLAGDLAELLKG
ncbi:MAG: hypothetical protein H6883_08505 [Rhodobiaceae bacterium]|nr:hypothetical protein [Rhodobiaceae bacterium]MCC0056164.1 hypothetical protein [Rhodobiaceae bacterium]